MTWTNPNEALAAYFGFRGTSTMSDLHEAADTELWPHVGLEYRKAITDAYGAMADAAAGLESALALIMDADASEQEATLKRLRSMLKSHHRSLTIYFKAVADAAGDPDLKERAERIAAAQKAYVDAWEQAVTAENMDSVGAVKDMLVHRLTEPNGTLH